MLAGSVGLLVLSAVVGDTWRAPTEPDTWTAMIFLVVGGSVAVFGLYAFLLGRWSASAVSYILLLQPLPTLVYSAFLRSEPLTPALIVGGAIMLLGVYIGALSPTRRGTTSEVAASPT
jgi:drug/metabolite transporter (DMT)-like permease